MWIIAHGEERGSGQVETVVGEEATEAGHVSPSRDLASSVEVEKVGSKLTGTTYSGGRAHGIHWSSTGCGAEEEEKPRVLPRVSTA